MPLPRPLLCLSALLLLAGLHCAPDGPSGSASALGAPGAGAGGAQPGAGQAGAASGASQASSAGSAGSAGDAGQAGAAQAGQGGDIEVTPAMFVAPGVSLDPIDEGEAIPFTLPPQGGHVLWIAAYFTNLRTDTVEMRSRLRDPATNELVAEEGRTVVVRPVEGSPGLFQPDIRTVSQVNHVPVCPDYDAKPIRDMPYLLEVSVRELYVEPQRTAKSTRTVVPTCSLMPEANRPLCECECEANYILGKCKDVPQPP